MSEVSSEQAGRDQVKQACTVLYDALPPLDAARLRAALQPRVGPCEVEWAAGQSGLPLTAGIVRFGPHRIAMLALDAPVKVDLLARTVGVSPMPEEERERLMAHRASIRLLYVGDAADPLAQLTTLYIVAGALLAEGGLGILNERAALAQPAELAITYLPQLGGSPPPLDLWVGVVPYLREEESPSRRYLMRTYGMEQFGLPELAYYISDRAAADAAHHLLLNTGLYMIEGGPSLKLEPGHTIEFGNRTSLRGTLYLLTSPDSDEPEFASPGGIFLLVEV